MQRSENNGVGREGRVATNDEQLGWKPSDTFFPPLSFVDYMKSSRSIPFIGRNA